MKIRALKSFSGALSMAKDDTVECSDENVVNDLLKAGYVELVDEKAPIAPVQQEQSGGTETPEGEQSGGTETPEEQQPEATKKTGRKSKNENK